MFIQKNKKAFSLVEILIVVALIALLAVIVIPSFVRARISSNYASTKSTLKVIGSALDNYSADNMAYPATTAALINTLPSYLQKDFFTGVHAGYEYTADTLDEYAYNIIATPSSESNGTKTFTLTTGSIIKETP